MGRETGLRMAQHPGAIRQDCPEHPDRKRSLPRRSENQCPGKLENFSVSFLLSPDSPPRLLIFFFRKRVILYAFLCMH